MSFAGDSTNERFQWTTGFTEINVRDVGTERRSMDCDRCRVLRSLLANTRLTISIESLKNTDLFVCLNAIVRAKRL